MRSVPILVALSVVAAPLALRAATYPGTAGPIVDHHQHLVSPAGAAWVNRVVPVSLPAEVGKLLAARTTHWNAPAALRPLYAPDTRVLDEVEHTWIGGDAAAEFIGTRFARPYGMTPLALDLAGDRAHVAGYFTRGTGVDVKHFGRFHLELAKAADGWRIVLEVPTFPGPPSEPVLSSERLVELLDEARVERAVVMSDAYWLDTPGAKSASVYPAVRAENDWTAAQAGAFPKRLVAFCSFNPLAEHALAELERCARSGKFTGIKLHFGVSKVDLDDAMHVAAVARVFAAANARKLPLAIHARGSKDRWNRTQVGLLLGEIISKAPDVDVQVAHLWGGEAYSQEVLDAFAGAIAAGDPATRRLYFDLADVALIATGEKAEPATKAMRVIGLERLLYGSDAAMVGHPTPAEAWAQLRANLKLTGAEIEAIRKNVAPYLR